MPYDGAVTPPFSNECASLVPSPPGWGLEHLRIIGSAWLSFFLLDCMSVSYMIGFAVAKSCVSFFFFFAGRGNLCLHGLLSRSFRDRVILLLSLLSFSSFFLSLFFLAWMLIC